MLIKKSTSLCQQAVNVQSHLRYTYIAMGLPSPAPFFLFACFSPSCYPWRYAENKEIRKKIKDNTCRCLFYVRGRKFSVKKTAMVYQGICNNKWRVIKYQRCSESTDRDPLVFWWLDMECQKKMRKLFFARLT